MSEIYLFLEVGPTADEIRSTCLRNDWARLERLHKNLRDATRLVANSLRGDGFAIVNCSAGNVTGHASFCSRDEASLREDINSLLGNTPLRLGIGSSLKDAYLGAFSGEACLNT